MMRLRSVSSGWLGVCLAVGMLRFVPAAALGGEVSQEDLTACKLPQGKLSLPQRGSPQAGQGYIFNFAQGKPVLSPFDVGGKKASSSEEFVGRIRAEKTGDLMYSSLNGGTLVALSGRIRDLGKSFLHELSGKELEKPAEVWGTKERDRNGKGTPGAIEGIAEGRCYLLETTGGKFALVRVVSQRNRTVTLQWVYQPSGTTQFEIPKGQEIPPKVTEEDAAPAEKPVDGPQPAAPVLKAEDLKDAGRLEKVVLAHLADRQILIQALMDAAKAKASPFIVNALGDMRAGEAAPLLASLIEKVAGGDSFEWTVDTFLCVPALVKIGKPGSSACVDAIVKMTPGERAGPWRAKLLCLVVVRVEGDKVAKILFEDQLTKATGKQETDNLKHVLGLFDEVKALK